jgi:hypothetical protein
MSATDSTRCYLVYAIAPEGTNAAEANRLFNEYVADERRGLVVYHDHFIGRHGGVAVFEVGSDEERERLDDPGGLEGWRIAIHPLVFSQTAVGFAAQTAFTLDRYRGTSLEQLEAQEKSSKRRWWQTA